MFFKLYLIYFVSSIEKEIDELFEEGIDILERFIRGNSDNLLLLTMLLENKTKLKKHFGKETNEIVLSFSLDRRLDEVYYRAGQYYAECGRPKAANEMLNTALTNNAAHAQAKALQLTIQDM